MDNKFSLNDVEVIKSNDLFTNDEMSKIIGGVSEMGCNCNCKRNSASNTASMEGSNDPY